MFYVYVIFRPNGVPCYVGKGSGNRVNIHKNKKDHPNPHLRRIYDLAGCDLPSVIIQRNLTEPQAFEYEMAFIAALGREDIRTGILVNLTDGGEGVSGIVWSDEMRQAKAIEVAKRWEDPAYKEKMANHNRGGKYNLGRKHSEETKAAASERMKGNTHAVGHKHSDETIRHLTEVRSDPAFKENASRKVKSLWDDPVYRAQQMASRAASEAYQNRAANRKRREECDA